MNIHDLGYDPDCTICHPKHSSVRYFTPRTLTAAGRTNMGLLAAARAEFAQLYLVKTPQGRYAITLRLDGDYSDEQQAQRMLDFWRDEVAAAIRVDL